MIIDLRNCHCVKSYKTTEVYTTVDHVSLFHAPQNHPLTVTVPIAVVVEVVVVMDVEVTVTVKISPWVNDVVG